MLFRNLQIKLTEGRLTGEKTFILIFIFMREVKSPEFKTSMTRFNCLLGSSRITLEESLVRD